MEASVADLAGNTVSIAVGGINIDATPLEIIWLSPDDGALVTDPRASVTAAFSDALSGVAPETIRLAVDGADVTAGSVLTAGQIVYTRGTEWPEGPHAAQVSMEDAAGNGAEAGATFEADTDGLPNVWELLFFTNLLETGAGDYDSDGLSNGDEVLANADPTVQDTDRDWFPDGVMGRVGELVRAGGGTGVRFAEGFRVSP